MTQEVCIVVPCYKIEFDKYEQISYDRLIKILGNYDIYIIAPKRIEKNLRRRTNVRIECFEDSDFEGRDAYSRLMLSERLYQRFVNYKYMLLCQLDVYVFADRLMDFCGLDYDYIGAPLPKYIWRNIYEVLKIKEEYCVGNGGFSLRKINSCIRVLKEKKAIYDKTGMGEFFDVGEDEFWGYCGNSDDIDFSIPQIDVACCFSMEIYDGVRFSRFPKELPFGCHGWFKEPWKKAWEPYVYGLDSLDEDCIHCFNSYLHRRKIEYIIDSLVLSNDLFTIGRYTPCFLPDNRNIVIWGYGKFGRLLYKLLKSLKIRIIRVIDRNPQVIEEAGVEVVIPEEGLRADRNDYIIIAAFEREDEIENILKSNRFVEKKDFIRCSELLEELICYSYGKNVDQVYMTI